MAKDVQLDGRMSDAEGLMWRLEKDPQLSSTIANVTILDRAPDFEQFTARMERAALAIPRLRQRAQASPGIAPPTWVDDPHFDIRYHVRHLALPRPGTLRQISDLATLIAVDPRGAGVGEEVFFVRGREASFPFYPVEPPVDASVVGIVDHWDLDADR